MILVFQVLQEFIYVELNNDKDIRISLGPRTEHKFYTIKEMVEAQTMSERALKDTLLLMDRVKKAKSLDSAKKYLILDLESDGATYLKDITMEEYKEIVMGVA